LKEKMVEKKSLYIRGPYFVTRFFLVSMMMLFFSLILIFWPYKMFFHDTYSRSNFFKVGENDTNQVWSEFSFKMYVDRFCEIWHISQVIHRNKLEIYRKILDTWNYILINFQFKWSSWHIISEVKVIRQVLSNPPD
jgi:hypothetical protein